MFFVAIQGVLETMIGIQDGKWNGIPMVFILHRYLFKELLRIFVLATIALTLMLSIGLLVPMIKEYGVGPRQMISLIGDFCPITLTFVIPISALFSAAMTYGRFAADRELDACRVSGIRFRSLIYPGLSLALLAAMASLSAPKRWYASVAPNAAAKGRANWSIGSEA